MSTKKLDDLRSRVRIFNALNSEEQEKKKVEMSRKTDALLKKISVDSFCAAMLKRVELLASMGINSLEVMTIDENLVGRGWTTDLFNNVPLEAINDSVTHKVYSRLGHMGLRPRIIHDVNGGCFRLIVSWGKEK